MTGKPIVLASQSSARQALLRHAGVVFSAEPAHIDERSVEAPLIEAGKSPKAVAQALAEAKALHVSKKCPGAIVLGCDQTLEADGRIWSKPGSLSDAGEQIRTLAGKTHRLHSAVTAVSGGVVQWHTVRTASLTMRSVAEAEIERYLDRVGDAALASVGAYQLEGLGVQLFETVEGDYFTILGLPLLPTLDWLRREGALAL